MRESEYSDTPIMDDGETDFLALARDAYDSSETYVDAFLRQQWEDGLRQWQGKHTTSSKYQSDAYKGRSKLFRPRTRAVIRKNEAACASAFFSTDDVVNIEPVDDSNEIDLLTAEIADGLVNYRLQNTIPWFQILNGAYQSTQVHGQVCSYQYWKYDGVKDEPCIDLRPIENIRIDPAADWLDPIGTSPYIIDLIPMFIGDIQEKFTVVDEKTGEPEWIEADEKTLMSATSEYYDSTRIVREDNYDSKSNYHSTNNKFNTAWVRRNIIRVKGQDWVFYTLGQEHLLSEPKKLEEVYFTGERPYVMGCAVLEANTPFPSSVCDITRAVQSEINDTCNQRLDNVKFVLNKRYFARRGAKVDLRSLTRNTPGSVTLMNDPDKDVVVQSTPDVTSSAFQEQDRLNLDFDDLAGTFSGSSVQANRQLNETVGGMNLMSQSANQVGEYQLRTFVETWVEPVLKQLVKLELKYETDDVVLGIAGKKSDTYIKYGFNQVTDKMLDGNLIVTVNVGTGATNPQTQVERFFFGLNSLAQVMGEEFIQKIDQEEVITEVFGKLGYKDGQRFFKQEEGQDPQIAQYEQMIQQLEQQLAQKENPEKVAAEIEKLNAETQRIKNEAVNKSVESTFSAMS
ncbi:MAG: hypothetical protein KAJ03_04520, partial [Gammaproteobacteria bacterium]|nr:hypothetical protein [Gammaproteobacteria bacterium]